MGSNDKGNDEDDGRDDANFTQVGAHFCDVELGRIVDELMASEFQQEKLRSRLIGKFSQYVHRADVYYSAVDRKELTSSFEFRHKGKAYRITIDVETNAENYSR
jgi:hypothetical protein